MAYVPDRSDPVIVQVRDVLEYMVGLEKATGTIQFTDQPTDGEVLVISDGTTAITYTFKDVVADDNDVEIASATDGPEETLYNLAAAINANSPDVVDSVGGKIIDPALGITVVLTVSTGTENDDVITLTNTKLGSAGNVAMTTDSSVITLVGMSGGADAPPTL